MTEIHKCVGCADDCPKQWVVTQVRPIYYGVVYYRTCPNGHQVIEHRRK